MSDLKKYDIPTEEWREYDFGGRIYRIESPSQLYVGITTHRIVDGGGVAHCVPSPGLCGCVLRWKTKDVSAPVNF